VHLKESVINISAGVDTSMCVTEKGEVFAWGRTKNGRIGLGMSEGNITQPRRLYLSPEYEGRALCVETGYVHSLIVVATGETLICGGVGVNDDVDGAAKGDDGKPRLIEAQEERLVNIWQRQNEILVKKEEVKWEKYGKYETKGRRAMMEEAKRWGV
jgi:E3 ubiquitin-protein ligase HERC2